MLQQQRDNTRWVAAKARVLALLGQAQVKTGTDEWRDTGAIGAGRVRASVQEQ
eukprot:CAMPEP_0181197520 /NCGR_PEP_ID=MMETSP1096-20121128/16094_1 /TAXON_ID=156174 ORGANISM="Chrysochromulina ericina, Strain CCMP281" /NCGR_SAMPLE_ID=MMETSP1096 /ASSEMBLY_ACC=CAM_ASM_000453 /LENGTH=52 /DNA_ID=CAMNT_0023287455 /DNA_START=338 /DNA_END=496 /DNA_ORIENTATION=-